MTFRLLVAGLEHETNTFSPRPTRLEDFAVREGDHLLAARGRSYVAGMLAAADRLGAQTVGGFWASAMPAGAIDADAYATLRRRLLGSVEAAGRVDAVALDLHGAAVAEGVDDVEGDVAAAVRELVGPDVPIVTALDLHGNVTPAMADVVDLLLGVHLYPHTDMYERGEEAVAAVPAILDGRFRPTTHVERLPMLVPSSTTDLEPAAGANRLCADIEAEDGVVDCTFFHGFSRADVPVVGASIVVTTHDDREAARAHACRVATWVWEQREGFLHDDDPPDAGVAKAAAIAREGRTPVVVNETSDNPGGGAAGDGTDLLKAMLDARLDNACFGALHDPESVAAAVAAGVGSTVDLALGAKRDDLHGEPIPVTATVRAITDGRFVLQAVGKGATASFGPSVRLEVGGLDIVVTSRADQVFDPEVFLLHGIDVRRRAIVGLKSANHFRAGFAPLAAAIVTVDGRGLTSERPNAFPRSRTPRPIWPLDREAEYRPTVPAASSGGR